MPSRRASLSSLAVVVLFSLPLLPEILGDRRLVFRDAQITHWPWRRVAVASLASGEVPFVNASASGGQPLLANPNAVLLYPTFLLERVARAGRGLQPPLPAARRVGVFRRTPPRPRARPRRRCGLPLGGRLRVLRNVAVLRVGVHELDRRGGVDAVVRRGRSRPGRGAGNRRGGAGGRRRGSGPRPAAPGRGARDLASDARLLRRSRPGKGPDAPPGRADAGARVARRRRSRGGCSRARPRGAVAAASRRRLSADLPRSASLFRARLRRGGLLAHAGDRVAAAALRRGPGASRRRRELARLRRRAQPRLHLVP